MKKIVDVTINGLKQLIHIFIVDLLISDIERVLQLQINRYFWFHNISLSRMRLVEVRTFILQFWHHDTNGIFQ